MTQVLVIDDHEDIREVFRLALESAGFDVVAVESWQDAPESMRTEPPDVVVTDYMMPGMTGHEVCRSLRASPFTRDVPIIMVSAHGDLVPQDTVECVDQLLGKPVTMNELVDAVRARLPR